MTDRLYPDALSSIGSLTRAEMARAKQIVQANPDAIWPAIRAALGIERGEQALDGMQAIFREARR